MAVTRSKVKPKVVKNGNRQQRPTITPASKMRAAVVGEIPPSTRGMTKSTKYRDALAGLRKLGGKRPAVIARYVGKGGASQAKRSLERGELLCDGDVKEWVLEARRDEGGGSTLYAQLK